MICYLNVGYPLGYVKGHSPNSADMRFEAEINGDIVELRADEVKIWLNSICGKEKNEIIESSKVKEIVFNRVVERLRRKKAIVEIDTENFGSLDEIIFLRQGIGIGSHEKEDVYQISLGVNAYIGKAAYDIWKMCNGTRSFGSIKGILGESSDNINQMCAALIAKGYIIAAGLTK